MPVANTPVTKGGENMSGEIRLQDVGEYNRSAQSATRLSKNHSNQKPVIVFSSFVHPFLHTISERNLTFLR
jgi:hypothetical protein